MPTRRRLSSLLPVLGAAVVTAGALLFQMARRPPTAHPTSRTIDGSGTAHPYPSSRTAAKGEVASVPSDAAFLRRLRERGL